MKTILFILTSLALTQAGHTESDKARLVHIEPEYRLAAVKYGVNPIMFKALLQVESGYDHKAVNPLTMDFGIGQINYRTAEAYNIDIKRLRSDRTYSIDRAAFILSTFQFKFQKREPATWVCRYNVGWQKLEGKAAKRCAHYLWKIKTAMEAI